MKKDKQKVCFVPLVENNQMRMLRVYSEDDLNSFEKNSMNFPEPSPSFLPPLSSSPIPREDGTLHPFSFSFLIVYY